MPLPQVDKNILPFASFVTSLPLPQLQGKLLLHPHLRGKFTFSRKPALTPRLGLLPLFCLPQPLTCPTSKDAFIFRSNPS